MSSNTPFLTQIYDIIMGVAGSIAAFLVDDNKNSTKTLASVVFVGGLSAMIFPPILFSVAEGYGANLEGTLSIALSGLFGALSWQLILSINKVLPAMFKKYIGVKKDENKDEK